MRKIIPLNASVPGNKFAGKALTDCKIAVRPILAASLLALAVVAVPMFFSGWPLAAQAPAAAPTPPAADQRSQGVNRAGNGTAANGTTATPELTKPAAGVPATTPTEPETPKWPVNEKPDQASVVWDSHGLRIDAANSSLKQIMDDVSSATGAKVEGLGTDERVFGSYGPGQAREVLSQLLDGSGYNVLMIGDQGQGTPRQIVFSARPSGGPQPAGRSNPTSNDEDNEAEEQPQPPQPDPGMNRGNFPGRTPQQIEMQQREQMRIQQMQQGQQPNQPPANPPN
ncbi:MAG: hypothetical protein ABSD67_06735 [Terracidiphilus sp.]|jgi:hypothetical protein